MTNIAPSYSPQLTRRIFASGAVGNILETYDLILISLMATTLSRVFFPPAENPYAHVIDVLYVFLIGLLVRPLGNIIMGLFADQIGRKKLMVISLTLTGVGTVLIGLLPSYYYIGIWATVLFILLRIFQNFFAGIEYINSASYLIESSGEKTRGYYGSWTAIGISGGYLLASLVALIISHLIAKNIIPEWSWRFIFLFSLVGIAFGIWIRNSIPESLVFIMNNVNTEPTRKWHILNSSLRFIKDHPSQCLSISAVTLMGICLSFIYYIYIPINLITTRGFSNNEVFSLNVLSLTLVVILIPIFGKMSDYYNRISLLKIVCCLTLLLAMPFFWFASYGTYPQIIFFTLLISIPSSCFFSLYPVMITESFPSKIRCTTASLIYQIIVSVEMGTLPLLVNYLIKTTKIPYSPGYLLIISTLLGLLGLIFLKKIDTDKF
jgi:MFS transporter, MHS family, proline/betaine transporter